MVTLSNGVQPTSVSWYSAHAGDPVPLASLDPYARQRLEAQLRGADDSGMGDDREELDSMHFGGLPEVESDDQLIDPDESTGDGGPLIAAGLARTSFHAGVPSTRVPGVTERLARAGTEGTGGSGEPLDHQRDRDDWRPLDRMIREVGMRLLPD